MIAIVSKRNEDLASCLLMDQTKEIVVEIPDDLHIRVGQTYEVENKCGTWRFLRKQNENELEGG